MLLATPSKSVISATNLMRALGILSESFKQQHDAVKLLWREILAKANNQSQTLFSDVNALKSVSLFT
jgi:hypothetical protein